MIGEGSDLLPAAALGNLRLVIEQMAVKRLVVGLSGGVDSVALLHSMVKAQLSPDISALHVNHNLQPAAEGFERLCRSFCKSLQVPLMVHHARVPGFASRNPASRNPASRNPASRNPANRNPANRNLEAAVRLARHAVLNDDDLGKRKGNAKTSLSEASLSAEGNELIKSLGSGNLEARARHARYAILSDELEPQDLLLLAHHADDQVETVLLNLIRGSRVPGLLGMPRTRTIEPRGKVWLYRPLLDIARADIQAYADQHQLNFIEDPTNADLRHDRNWIRHQLIPHLEQDWPDFRQSLLARLLRDEQLRQQQQESHGRQLAQLQDNQAAPNDSLHLEKLRQLAASDKTEVIGLLDHWLMSLQLPMPSQGVMQELLDTFLVGGTSTGVIRYDNLEFRCHQGRLHLLRQIPELNLPNQDWLPADLISSFLSASQAPQQSAHQSPSPANPAAQPTASTHQAPSPVNPAAQPTASTHQTPSPANPAAQLTASTHQSPSPANPAAQLTASTHQAPSSTGQELAREFATPWGSISITLTRGRGLRQLPDYELATRSGGEKMKLGRTRTLKNLFQAVSMPAWLRDAVPLITHQGKLAALPSVPAWGVPMQIADDYAATAKDPGIEIHLHFSDHLHSVYY